MFDGHDSEKMRKALEGAYFWLWGWPVAAAGGVLVSLYLSEYK